MTICQIWFRQTYLAEEHQISQVNIATFTLVHKENQFYRLNKLTGRDTPSSQITEGDEGRGVGENRQLDLAPPTISAKQSRSEIDDKFCKFEIKKLMEGMQTLSLFLIFSFQ